MACEPRTLSGLTSMHIPDGFLDLRTAATAAMLAGVGLAFALRDVRRRLPPRRVPLIGLAAAFVFAAQMINFPVAAGTSGHLIGAALVTVLLGPGPAVVAMTAVLLLQSLMFADGASPRSVPTSSTLRSSRRPWRRWSMRSCGD